MPLKLRRSGRYTFDKLYTLHIRLLDNTIMDINIPLAAKGKDCLQKIAQYIGLFEVCIKLKSSLNVFFKVV